MLKSEHKPMVWENRGAFRVEVSRDVLPHDVMLMKGMLDLSWDWLEELARTNSWKRHNCDPIYLGM